ncbi:MAG TPA: PilN domain-containing protein [Phycisphaerales bacterium]
MLTANLLPMARRRASAREDRAVLWMFVTVTLALTLAAATATIHMTARSTTAEATARELTTVQTELERLGTLVQESRSRAQKSESLLAAARAIADHPDWSLLLNLMGKLRGDQVDLARIALGYKKPDANAKPAAKAQRGYWVRITGQAVDQAGVARFAVRLEESGLFDKVTLTESKKNPTAALVDFQIDAVIEDQSPGGVP